MGGRQLVSIDLKPGQQLDQDSLPPPTISLRPFRARSTPTPNTGLNPDLIIPDQLVNPTRSNTREDNTPKPETPDA